jgi:hypothetical protein
MSLRATAAAIAVGALMGLVTDYTDAHTVRSKAARDAFMRSTVCPSTHKKSRRCPNYIVDHVCALAQGGRDAAINMQYQTIADSKAKDRIENTPVGKALYCDKKNSTPTRQVFNK